LRGPGFAPIRPVASIACRLEVLVGRQSEKRQMGVAIKTVTDDPPRP